MTRFYDAVNTFLLIDDPVFMPNSIGREEFLYSEVGKIFVGSRNLIQGRPWVYGQHRDSVLASVVHVLDSVGTLKSAHRGDPVKVAREIAKVVSKISGSATGLGNL